MMKQKTNQLLKNSVEEKNRDQLELIWPTNHLRYEIGVKKSDS
jgi:hypothetical protein